MFNGQNCDLTKLFQKANQLNNFFCSVGEDLTKKVSLFQTVDYSLYLRHRVPNSIFFEPPTVNENIACIVSLNMNKAVGYDNIPAYFLKMAAAIIAPFLCFLIDYAFLNGIFPDNCKIAKLIPIHKKGKKDNPSNFRPISILTCISKVIEKMIYKRVFSSSSSSFFIARFSVRVAGAVAQD